MDSRTRAQHGKPQKQATANACSLTSDLQRAQQRIRQKALEDRQIPQEHLEFFNELRPYYETDNFIFVHAGLKPGVLLQDQEIDDLLWIRDEFLYSEYEWGKTIVFGHTMSRLPILLKNRICLDTGCVYSAEEGYGRLSCCDVISRVVWSA